MAVGRRSEAATPYTREIHVKTTRFEMEATPRAHGEPCLAVRVRCSVRVSSEQRFIGGTSCRVELTAGVGDGGGEAEFAVDDPAVLRSEDACRGAIRRMLMTLPQLMWYYGDRADEAQWEDYACDVSMHVHASLVYSEAKALVESCEAATPAAARRRGSHVNDEGGGGTAQCAICMEELSSSAAAGADASDDDVTNLPCCSHAFHRGCILRWFDKAPTCPFCRRDMMQYLTATYRLYHMLQHYIPNKKF
ncbi:uncharacterized protein LOC121053247 [Oryza brachyantha]|uniref:uncharacterized protein LOC121053247 n=1 Tax=Oryza brachyantha TaxID=4533 RepID=UPI001ADCFE29|nr:uncharacterized protein LOC121053247 [Oryza brachyantha]